jgi:hypothetical protein
MTARLAVADASGRRLPVAAVKALLRLAAHDAATVAIRASIKGVDPAVGVGEAHESAHNFSSRSTSAARFLASMVGVAQM